MCNCLCRHASNATATSVYRGEWPLTGYFRGDTSRQLLAGHNWQRLKHRGAREGPQLKGQGQNRTGEILPSWIVGGLAET
jgi:hypothetical protein